MAIALYRKYRSKNLTDIVGQEHVTTLLARAIETDKIAHAYLFTGPRGVGKTSIARIVAHAINRLEYTDTSSYLDIIEIDAASNNGVEDIRDLREKVNLAPVQAKKKIYIIDEVHMLSKPAFNALLKTLEEPPEHVVFILATTDAEKLPATIVSRTQRHSFKRATEANIIKNLKSIAEAEAIKIDDAALEIIALHSDGSYRDSVSLLDQLQSLSSGNTITAEMVENSLGLASKKVISSLLEAATVRDFERASKELKALLASGIQAKIVAEQLIFELKASISMNREAIALLDDLLLVASSPIPEAKLLVVIAQHALQGHDYTPPVMKKPTPVQRAVSVATQPTAVIPELEKKAKQPHPKDDIVKKAKKKSISTQLSVDIDWSAILEYVKTHGIGIHSVLTKCSYSVNDNALTIFARGEFYKKKLELPRYQQILRDGLNEQSTTDWEITVVPTTKPSENSQINSVAAIMGGGEEVKIGDSPIG